MSDNQLVRSVSREQVQGLERFTAEVEKSLVSQDEVLLDSTLQLVNTSPGILSRFFPNAFEKERQQIAADVLRSAHQRRLTVLQAYTAARLEIARIEFVSLIGRFSLARQEELTAFGELKFIELQQKLVQNAEIFVEQWIDHRNFIDKFRDNRVVYDPLLRSAEERLKLFFDMITESCALFKKEVVARASSFSS